MKYNQLANISLRESIQSHFWKYVQLHHRNPSQIRQAWTWCAHQYAQRYRKEDDQTEKPDCSIFTLVHSPSLWSPSKSKRGLFLVFSPRTSTFQAAKKDTKLVFCNGRRISGVTSMAMVHFSRTFAPSAWNGNWYPENSPRCVLKRKD